jgi:hypothetical protein
MTRLRLLIILVTTIGSAFAVYLLLRCKCPESGIGFTQERLSLQRLKNRVALPREDDFDSRATAESMLADGNDTDRWSSAKAVRVKVFVISVASARPEAANCFARRDTHIHAALRANAPKSEHLVLEVTPRLEDFARQQGLDWSATTLKQTLEGRWVTFEGWLLFDAEHAKESENIRPASPENWRRTAWEIHPITHIQMNP